jgi:hypothetical protein
MTVDSAYFIEQYNADSEVEYPFRFESIDDVEIQVFIVEPDGTRITLYPTPE